MTGSARPAPTPWLAKLEHKPTARRRAALWAARVPGPAATVGSPKPKPQAVALVDGWQAPRTRVVAEALDQRPQVPGPPLVVPAPEAPDRKPLPAGGTWSEVDARRWLVLWATSGLTINQYERNHGIAHSKLARWRKRLAAPKAVGV